VTSWHGASPACCSSGSTTRVSDGRPGLLGHQATRPSTRIDARLFVPEKALSKHTNSIFTKLDLPLDSDDHRRVLAVLTYLKA
jgi:hypothetical protein